MIRLLFISFCFAYLSFADNFIKSEAWAKEDEYLIDSRFPNDQLPAKTPLTMPKTPLPPIEPIYRDEPSASAPQTEPIFEPTTTDDRAEALFWIQIGAFSNPQNASDFSRKLIERGYDAKVFAKELNRVAVGPYVSVNQAEEALYNVRLFEPNAFITKAEHFK